MAVFGEEKTHAIHAFLKNYVVFKKTETNRKFMKKRDQILGKNNTMDIFDQIVEINVQEGLEEGMQKGLEKAVRKLVANTKFSPETIAELLEVPVSLVEKIKE